MRDITTSTIVSLVYAKKPEVDFKSYVAELEVALRSSEHESCELRWEYDDFAVFDIDGSRVVAAYCDTLAERDDLDENGEEPEGEAYSTLMLLAVGYGLRTGASTLIADHRDDMCRAVVRRIQRKNPADLVLWRSFDRPFTPEDFDQFMQEMPRQPSTMTPPPMSSEELPKKSKKETDRFGSLPVNRLIERWQEEFSSDAILKKAAEAPDLVQAAAPYSSSFAEKAAAWKSEIAAEDAEILEQVAAVSAPGEAANDLRSDAGKSDVGASHAGAASGEPEQKKIVAFSPTRPERHKGFRKEIKRPVMPSLSEPVEPANDTPDFPAPMVSEMERIRMAIYAEEYGLLPPEKAPLAQRLTIYSFNTTLMIVALPVGAALLTYNCLGREDLGVTSRVMALTGAAIGMAQLPVFSQILSSFS